MNVAARRLPQTRRAPRRVPRCGAGLLLILVPVILLVGVIGGVLMHGAGKQGRFNELLAEGSQQIEKNQPVPAAEAFLKANEQFGGTLSFYQTVKRWTGATYLTPAELGQLIVSACLMQAYTDFFAMQPSPDILSKASSVESLLTSDEGLELKQALGTAKRMSAICEAFKKQQYQQVMKDLLRAEKEATKTDLDFFIQEIRVLIACGQAMDEPEILNHARELLFFYTYEAKLKNPRIDQLWRILSQ